MFKMPVNRVPGSLLNKVPQVPKYLEFPSSLSASSITVSWVAWVIDCHNAPVPTKCLKSAQAGQSFGYFFVRINKSVRNTALTEWFSCKNCWIIVLHKWIILLYLNTRKQYPSGGVGRAYLIYIFQNTHQKWLFFLKEHFSLILQWTAFNNQALISSKIRVCWLNSFFFSYIKLCWWTPY